MKYLPIEDSTVSFDAWFHDKTGLVGEIRLDLTEAVQEMEGASNDNATCLFSLRLQNIKLEVRIFEEFLSIGKKKRANWDRDENHRQFQDFLRRQ